MRHRKYHQLVEVSILHSYYKDGLFEDISIVPDKQTQAFMWNAGLLFRLTDVGFSVYYSDPFDSKYLSDLTDFFEGHHLRFQLISESDDFNNFTDVPLGKLVIFQYDNRRHRTSNGISVLLPKLDQHLFARSPLANIDLYLSEFIDGKKLIPNQYTILYAARETRWKYYLLNVDESYAESLKIVDYEGREFEGPFAVGLPNGKPAFEFSSGRYLYPFKEKPVDFCSLKKRANKSSEKESQQDATVLESLPVPSPKSITSIENQNEDEPVACSSVYVYL